MKPTENPAADALLFEGLLEAAPDAIVIIDDAGTIRLVNAQAERLFGYARSELLGATVEMLVPERFHASHVDQRAHYFAAPGTRPMGAGLELFGRRKDGSEFPVEISLSPLQTRRGAFAISAIRDITDRKRADAERTRLLQERAATYEANRLKDEFLATLSHELRTPLNAILGYARLFRTGALTDERRERALEVIERNAAALHQLVADILDVSRIISGKIRLDVQQCQPAEILDRALDALLPAIEAKSLRVTRDVVTEAGPISCDPERLQQVFWNLLANAVKFTPEGGSIQIRVTRFESRVEVVVTDSGVGIPAEFIPHLFERFRQADSRLSREYGGLGLGLALVRQFVQLHGGTIAAYSGGVGRGATFVVHLPLASRSVRPENGERRDRRQEPHAAGRVHLEGVRVLAIDDDPDALSLLADVLGDAGAFVSRATSGFEGLAMAEQLHPDVVVCDLGMPRMDGFEFIRRLRTGPSGRVPAAAVTAYARSEDRTRCLIAGFQLHIAKPFNTTEVLAAVRSLADVSSAGAR
jgi:PAS domain S-box-containing protein